MHRSQQQQGSDRSQHFFPLKKADRFWSALSARLGPESSVLDSAAECIESQQQQGSDRSQHFFPLEKADRFWSAPMSSNTWSFPRLLGGMSGVLNLEGQDLVSVPLGFTDTASTTCLHVPSIGLIVAGDAAYNGVHLHLSESPD